VACGKLLRVGCIRLSFIIDAIRNASNDECFHLLISMGHLQKAIAFHLNRQSISIVLFEKFPGSRTRRAYNFFACRDGGDKNPGNWIRD